ncbi:MAG: N-acetyltransferase [Peptostreptococcaceae bacterium]|nr:N-acetyltransferase [Peptostreptococcaceae bacterium]
MIRELREEETNEIMKIWQEATIKAHQFIHESYWMELCAVIKENYIPNSETFVYEHDGIIKGFISMTEDGFISGIFVDVKYQGMSIGKGLMAFAKNTHSELTLDVYEENLKAVSFYKRTGFEVAGKRVNEDTDKVELLMKWVK